MTVLIDPPLWWHGERRFSHVVSDRDLDELHAFAAANGLPRRAFHGDHYDVPEEWYDEMIARGARAVTTRELVWALRRAGLRLTPAARRASGSAPPAAPGAGPPGSG